tara:strand:+ start:344 stop:553 length:210 start_codon:yes stop_codon:yes gene_type:complete
MPRKLKPTSQRQRKQKGFSPSWMVLLFMSVRPVAAQAQPRMTKPTPVVHSLLPRSMASVGSVRAANVWW